MLNLSEVLRDLTPRDVLDKLEIKTFQVEGISYAECQECKKKKLKLGSKFFYCENKTCLTKTLSPLDFTLNHFDNDIGKAVKFLVSKCADNLNGITAYDPDYVEELLAIEVQRNIDLNKDIEKLFKNNTEWNKHHECTGWLRRNTTSINPILKVVICTTEYEARNMLSKHLSDNQYKKLKANKNSPVLMTPLYSNHGTVSGFYFKIIKTNKTLKIWKEQARYNFTNLNSIQPESGTEFLIYEDFNSWVKMYSYHKDALNEKQTPVFLVTNENPYDGNVFDKGVLFVNEETKPELAWELSRVFKNFYVSDDDSTKAIIKRITLQDWLLDKFISIFIKEKEINDKVEKFLGSVRASSNLLLRCSKWLESNGYEHCSLRINGINGSEKVVSLNRFNILTTPYGYQIQKKGKSTHTFVPFTNFSIKLDKGIVFRNSDDTFYTGTLTVRGINYPLTLNKKDFTRYSHIETACQVAYKNAIKDSEEIGKLPIITDTTFGACLCHLLNYKAAEVDTVFGIDLLGWDKKENIFYGPGWKIGERGFEPNMGETHKGMETFNYYTLKPFKKEGYSDIDIQSKRVLSAIAAMLCRSYVGAAIKAIPVQNNIHARNLMRFCFRALGQISAVEINPNIRGHNQNPNLPGLSDYPFYAICSNREKVDRITLPAFILTESGIVIPKGLDKENYPNIASMTLKMVKIVTSWLVKTSGDKFKLLGPDADFDDLVNEGSKVIRDLGIFKDWNTSINFGDSIIQLFGEMNEDDIKNRYYFDFENQKVVTSKESKILEHWKKVDKSASIWNKKYITISPEIFNQMVMEFYGSTISLNKFKNIEDKNNDGSSVDPLVIESVGV